MTGTAVKKIVNNFQIEENDESAKVFLSNPSVTERHKNMQIFFTICLTEINISK